MATKKTRTRPRSSATGAVQTPALPDDSGIYAELLAGEIGQHFKPSTDLQAVAQRFAAAAETPNGRGWVRLTELLEQAAGDPQVRASLGASEFLAIVTVLAGDGILDESASPRLRELYTLMSNRGGGPKRRVNPQTVLRMHRDGVSNTQISEALNCDVSTVRRILREKP